jgi:hypothetical protein
VLLWQLWQPPLLLLQLLWHAGFITMLLLLVICSQWQSAIRHGMLLWHVCQVLLLLLLCWW